ncbi:MAG: AMP-binding protein [Comamonas sp.]|jgi:acyl-CoA synthetase (AMP-forming)/AMP-acid ligase II|uniref:AMP-binding protein n=1 Tax=Comamonas sp. TaxID=34028 RepID=UPI002818290B|nr:AMP-binding protein [Comamonas sp.]MDR0215168.1 AMP-binding protein [Comamonas sp.]
MNSVSMTPTEAQGGNLPAHAPLHGFWQLVHGPLAHWAQHRPEVIALQSEEGSWTFAQLHAEVQKRSQALIASRAPQMVLIDASRSTLQRLVDFLAIIASGRCAAVADPDWQPAVHQRIEGWLPLQPSTQDMAEPLAAFYTGFTSGSTGLPKGFKRHHQSWTESFRVGLQDFGPVVAQCTLAPGRISHSLFLFGAMQGIWYGTGAVMQEKFSAARCLATLASGQAPCLVAVPSQLLLMLQWAEHRHIAPIPEVELITISGARWMRDHTPALRKLFPKARIIEFYGASEASFVAWMEADEASSPQAVGRPFSNVEIDIRTDRSSTEEVDSANPSNPSLDGLIYIRSPMLFMDYVGDAHDPTAVLRDGDWLSVRDMGHLDERGMLCLAGRQSRMIVTQGKNLFPEELENLLASHPAIAQVSLHGQADALRGMQVHAVLQWQPGAMPPSALQLAQWLRERTEAFKVPRQWWTCSHWPQTASSKTDHGRIGKALLQMQVSGSSTPDLPALQPWHS